MDELLAKPDVFLLEHLRDVTERGEEISKRLGLNPILRAQVLLACALHDVGKATKSFQSYIRGRCNKAYPHALASLPVILVAERQLIKNQNSRRWLATAAVLSHHSPLTVNLYQGFGGPPDYLPDLLKELLQEIGHLLDSLGLDGLSSVEEWDRLVCEPPSALLDKPFPFDAENHTLRGLLRALPPKDFAQVKSILHLSDWLASAQRMAPAMIFLQDGASIIKEYIKQRGLRLRKFQEVAEQNYGRNVYLRAPTGTGKTEALLLWAGNADRLIYLLPTQATVNAMWRRLRAIYGDERVGLAHGRASYILRKENEEDEPPLDARLFGSVFAKPVTVATLDQYLLAHLHGRHWEERRALARNSTLVLDEIHSYEPYTLGMLSEALRREPPARIALASATLPPALLNLLPSLEVSIEAEKNLWQRQRYKLDLRDGLLPDALDQIVTESQQGKQVLVVTNTVVQAQNIYQQLAKQLKKPRYDRSLLRLLHSRFSFRDRQRKEEQVMAPTPGVILVATQVVEVSLDISYDVLFTEIAPLDAIVQRMGRVNRRGENPPVPVRVFCQWDDRSEYLYGRGMLAASQGLLKALPQLPTDQDLMEATHHLYETIVPSETFRREWEEGQQALNEVQQILGCYTIDLSDEKIKEKFTARRGHLSMDVLPEALLQEAYQLHEGNERWRIVELLVPIPIWWTIQFSDAFYPCSDLRCSVCRFSYDDKVGLSPPSEKDLGKRTSGVIY